MDIEITLANLENILDYLIKNDKKDKFTTRYVECKINTYFRTKEKRKRDYGFGLNGLWNRCIGRPISEEKEIYFKTGTDKFTEDELNNRGYMVKDNLVFIPYKIEIDFFDNSTKRSEDFTFFSKEDFIRGMKMIKSKTS